MVAKRVIHFEIQVEDFERAKDFYEKVFDWEINQAMEKENGGMDYWLLTTGPEGTPGINGGMYIRPKQNPLYTYDCTISVDDIDKAMQLIKDNGGKILREKVDMPEMRWFSRATDSEGNIFGLM